MSLGGKLSDLPIVDVIQLLNTTRKSGTLSVKRGKKEGRIIFDQGYVVSASHAKDDINLGSALCDMGALAPEALQQALDEKQKGGDAERPLVAILIEKDSLSKEEAFKGLQKLIELTVVEFVGWSRGSFTFDVEATELPEDFKYFSEVLNQEVCVDTQMLLMDSLRIYDEMQRDGLIEEGDDEDEDESFGEPGEAEPQISAGDLGLDNLDNLDRKIPGVFSSIKAFDPADIHRQIIDETMGELSEDAQERLVSFLKEYSLHQAGSDDAGQKEDQNGAVILSTGDTFFEHCLMTVCKGEGTMVFSAKIGNADDLASKVNRCLSKKIIPLIVMDDPAPSDNAFIRDKYRNVSTIHFSPALDYHSLIKSFKDKALAVFPRPSRELCKDSFVEDITDFLKVFHSYIKDFFHGHRQTSIKRLEAALSKIESVKEPQDISFVLLNFVSEMFERSITFVVRGEELIAERGMGVRAAKSEGPTPAMKFKVPIASSPFLKDIVGEGNLFFGEPDDAGLKGTLFKEIGAPADGTILFLPIRKKGRTIALIYGDFGQSTPYPLSLDSLQIVANRVALVL